MLRGSARRRPWSARSAKKDRKTKITALRRAITEAETKRKNLVRNLELTDVDQDFVRDVNERRAELQGEIETLKAQLTTAEDEVQQASNPGLLDFLPVTPVELTDLPDELSRKLFEALRLEIHYDYVSRSATCRVTLLGDTIEAVSKTTQEAVVIPFQKQKGPTMEDLHGGTVCVVPPAGFEPALPPPEGGALSPELRGP